MMSKEDVILETDAGFYKFEVLRIANLGNWREQGDNQEDIVTAKVKFANSKDELDYTN